jgi:Ca2+-binding RTX toxin-like protein
MRVDLQIGEATGLGRDTLASIEDVQGGRNNDVLLGSRADNTFYIAYIISSRHGRDVIDGRGGRDRLEVTHDAQEGLRADLARGRALLGPGRGRAQLASIEDLTGSDYDRDVLRGNSRSNTIRGLGGDDSIIGRGGDDRLFGGPGQDGLSGGDGQDILRGDAGADRLRGGRGNDRLNGGRGGDVNNGGRGRDTCLSPARGPSTRSCE